MSTAWFSKALLPWYRVHHRSLPWRDTTDPYRIWLSEVILQQTRVDQGLAYWERFVERYPTVADLAAANEDEVLRLWQGLGSYSRARNLLTTSGWNSRRAALSTRTTRPSRALRLCTAR